MSAYVVRPTPMTDRDCLVAALADLGLRTVEVHEEPVALIGFEGSARAQRAHVVIRRANIGASSNDLGFLETPTGYRAMISAYDGRRYGAAWMAKLVERYTAHEQERDARLAEEERQRIEEQRRALVEAQRQAIHRRARELGYRVTEKREGEAVRLVLVRRTY